MSIEKDVQELLNANIITTETADTIQRYYKEKSTHSVNRLFIVFGILGAILIGLGIILIIAHNWDEFSRNVKTLLAFSPLLIGQIICLYTLLKKKENVIWRESGSAFLFFAVGASIALISQIYNIPGDLGNFLFTWMLLCLPVIYIMRSSIVSLLYWIGITYYSVQVGYLDYGSEENYAYWFLVLAALPYYYYLFKKAPKSNFMIFHNWIIPLSLVITLGTIADNNEDIMLVSYFSLFGLFYLIGNLEYFNSQKLRNYAYRIIGILGTLVLMLAFSFDFFWENLREENFVLSEVLISPEFISASILSIIAAVLLVKELKTRSLKNISPFAYIFLLFIPTFIIGANSTFAVVLMNIYVFAVGIITIKNGANRDNLALMNFGLLIITILVICRFFDTDLSFVTRGLLFLGVGVGFFLTNYWMLKKRKKNEIK